MLAVRGGETAVLACHLEAALEKDIEARGLLRTAQNTPTRTAPDVPSELAHLMQQVMEHTPLRAGARGKFGTEFASDVPPELARLMQQMMEARKAQQQQQQTSNAHPPVD